MVEGLRKEKMQGKRRGGCRGEGGDRALEGRAKEGREARSTSASSWIERDGGRMEEQREGMTHFLQRTC